MNLPNQKPPSQRFTPLPQMQFIPWSAQAPSAFRSSHPLAHLAPFHLPLYFQQQNNYYNTNITQTPLQYPYHPYPQAPRPSSSPWLPHPPAPTPSSRPSKPKGQIPVICLDEESPSSVIVISESEEDPPCSKKPEAASKTARVLMSDLLQRSRRVQSIQRETQRDRSEKSSLIRSFKEDQPKGAAPVLRRQKYKEVAKLEKDRGQMTTEKTKIISKKSMSNRSFYKLTPHQKKLWQLSQCREYMPGQVMVGPQFQAQLPCFRGCLGTSAIRLERKCWLKVRQEGLLSRLQK